MWVKAHHGAKAWLSSTDHPNYEAAKSAVKTVFGQTPDMTREGGSIPIATWLEVRAGRMRRISKAILALHTNAQSAPPRSTRRRTPPR